MLQTLNDFVIASPKGSLGTLDIPRLLVLSDDEFLSVHIETARRYLTNHNGSPNCHECHTPISAPEELIRHYGANLHTECFVSTYERDTPPEETETTKRYWNRIARLVQ